MGFATHSPSRIKRLRQLADLMNTRHQNPFPITGELLGCFDIALSDEEIDFLLTMGTEPYTYEQAASARNSSDFSNFFKRLIKKGLAWPQENQDGRALFALPGIMMGWFEVYLSDGEESPAKREFARRLDKLVKSFGKYNTVLLRSFFNENVRRSKPHQSILAPSNPPGRGQGRTIAVGKSVDVEPVKIYPSRTVEELIEKHGDEGSIAALYCFCRQYHKMIGEPCRFEHPPQSCLAIGILGRHAVEHGMGQSLTKSEAISLIRELQSKGAVHQVFHKDEDVHNPEVAICNCCWDCCGVFGSYNRGLLPLNLHAFFEARLEDASLCMGCGTCENYCPVQAITLVDDKCRIDSQMCIGCGQCEIQCPEQALTLVANERTVFLPLRQKSDARIQ